jgi:peptidoglycan/xylan/chitin deacetylase (PgdA/CDA1 family)
MRATVGAMRRAEPPRHRARGARAGSPVSRRIKLRRRRAGLGAIVIGVLLLVALLAGRGSGGNARSAASSNAAHQRDTRVSASHGGASSHADSAARNGSPESGEVHRLIALGKPIYCAGRRGDEVALTFDDGPGPYTRLVLAKLRKHGVRATFFVVGRNIPLIAGATRQERSIGAVGDHTFTHPLLTALAPGEAEGEIVHTQAALERSTGGPVFLFRPPYGAHDSTIDAIVHAHGLLEILWTVDSADSLGANYAQIERNVIAGLRGGAIILMHENHGQTVRALLSIFAALQRKHLRAVSVPELLTDDPPSLAQVRAGGLGCGVRGGTLTGG